MPYVTRYLVNELAAMNIKVAFDVEKISCWDVCCSNPIQSNPIHRKG